MKTPPTNQLPAGDARGAPAGPPALAKQKRDRAFYSYLLMWVTGLIFLFVERDDVDVKYHAAQSLVFFGAAGILTAILDGVAAMNHLLWFVGWISGLVAFFTFVVWIFAMYRAWSDDGARFEIPLVKALITPYAERVARAA